MPHWVCVCVCVFVWGCVIYLQQQSEKNCTLQMYWLVSCGGHADIYLTKCLSDGLNVWANEWLTVKAEVKAANGWLPTTDLLRSEWRRWQSGSNADTYLVFFYIHMFVYTPMCGCLCLHMHYSFTFFSVDPFSLQCRNIGLRNIPQISRLQRTFPTLNAHA